jgi:hypothetical protein
MKKKTPFGQSVSRWLITVLSLLVIFQAVILANQIKKNSLPKPLGYIPVAKIEEVSGATVGLAFVPGGASIRRGETASFDLVLTPKRKLRLDGIRLVLNFNPEQTQLLQVTTPRLFSSVAQNREGEKEGKILLTFLEEKPEGLWFDKATKLLTLALKGVKMGETEVSVVVEGEGPQTVITESGSSKKILFDRGNLKLVVD